MTQLSGRRRVCQKTNEGVKARRRYLFPAPEAAEHMNRPLKKEKHCEFQDFPKSRTNSLIMRSDIFQNEFKDMKNFGGG
jgi:hypothetical protein